MKKILIAGAILVVAVIALWSAFKTTAQVAVVASGRAIKAVPGSVSVRAEFLIEIKCEIGGRVLSSQLVVGKSVAKGDVLLQIDPGDLELDIERTQIEYDATKQRLAVGSSVRLELESARDTLENYERLAKTGNFPLVELEKQRRAFKQVEQRMALEDVENKQVIDSYENTLKTKRRQLAKMTITAPFDGVIAEVITPPGDLIRPGSPVGSIISKSCTVEARISEESYSSVHDGQRATVRFLGYGDTTFPATVTKILPTADPETQRYVAILDVKIDAEKLVPGLTGEVNIVVGERDAQALIPRRALVDNTVYLVENGRVRIHKVEVGYVSLNTAEITKGLAAGDQVVVEDLDQFRDGDRVRAELVK